MQRRILSMLVEHEPGALAYVANCFSARGFNIESLTVAPTLDPTLARMTIETRGDERIIEQLKKQMNKLVDVVKLIDVTEGPHIERELLLIKVHLPNYEKRNNVLNVLNIFRGRVLNVGHHDYTIELTGNKEKIDAFIEAIDGVEIVEVVCSGILAISRGKNALKL